MHNYYWSCMALALTLTRNTRCKPCQINLYVQRHQLNYLNINTQPNLSKPPPLVSNQEV